MSENSKIEWTDHTFNPFIGCTKVSPGCDNCYAEHLMDTRLHKVVWGVHGERVRTSAATWREPIRWNARHAEFFAAHGRRQRVFCASLADVFDNAVDPAWRRDLFALIASTPNLDWLLLTKRIGNVAEMLRGIGIDRLPDNVWLGATVVNQAEADRDIPKLLAVPARVRFLSMEPLLGPVELHADWIDRNPARGRFGCVMPNVDTPARYIMPPTLDWVIAGGESGAGARPMHPAWAADLRDQCARAGVPFLFKQWGEWLPVETDGDCYGVADDGSDRELGGRFRMTTLGTQQFLRVGKRAAGRLLDGRTHNEFPEAR
ncbi:phage Gp37/Gp68 family protein [Burkholderia ubonensis]|uniref:Phage Gp37/Gp68 family protein n=1 Tax=Burkholderia ubonensis TaxID=101571 RepID=A0A125G2L1_9BURK|nr:phage Gp37/Gp68 family protein [Burkholderia ubonensis]KWD81822.1 hypothetical protein WL70_17705 [Burkholderia ubonensis]KWD83782.1 hypothetical protein WL71_15810 [Burkholderia ubonensis]KWE04652.1 hypothetical protein WL72_01070 [Burkholderia ubonensis]KWE11027.1 hypothetical protein WL73_33320 [Burkholderia ubonensis]